MSAIFVLLQPAPTITSTEIVAASGEKITIFGSEFKRNIIKISGQNIYNSSLDFVFNGKYNENISGIDNSSLNENSVGFTINNIYPSKYQVYLYNYDGVSSNYLNLNILGKPSISGFDNKNVLPGDYVRVSGFNLFGGPIYFVDSTGNKIYPSFQETGLYTITGSIIQNYGTGYKVGDIFNIQGIKNYESNSYARLTVTTTGINGSVGSYNINNSGVFTVPNLSTGIELVPNSGNGRGALVNFLYKKYENTGNLDFIEFQIPYNIKRNQSGIIENIKYKGNSGAAFDGFYISGYPNIYGFSPTAGTVDSSNIFVSGDNFSLGASFKIGNVDINSYQLIGDTGLSFTIPNLSSSDYIYISGKYGIEKSANILNISYPPVIASGYTPNNILGGTGTIVSISGKYLQRINYINLGQPNITKDNLTINSSGTLAAFKLPDLYTQTKLSIYSIDFPNSGTLIRSIDSNDLLINTPPLSLSNVNIRYLSGIEAAKYLDEIEIYTSSGTSGDYGNLSDSDVFFLGMIGSAENENAYSISGIKVNNSPTGIRFKVPREVRNPQARIKIKRNRFGESYILPSTKSIDVLPTIYDVTRSNTLYNSLGYLRISGINASNANLVYFSGYSGTKDLFGFKDQTKYYLTEIINRDSTQIVNNPTDGYTVFEVKLGGNITGSGELFLFNNYYDTGIGYENQNITQNKNIRVSAISGYRPPNSDIFTVPSYVSSPLDAPFFYEIQTNSRATKFEFIPTTSSGVGDVQFPSGIETYLNSKNQIFGQPSVGGFSYFKIRAIDGDRPDEGMILTLNIGSSGRMITSPGITYRGAWSDTVGYVGNSLRRDVVKYNSDGINYWYAAFTNINSEPKLGNSDWIQFSNEFSATATKILLAEDSTITNSLNIGEAGILSGYIKSSNDQNVDIGSGFFLGFDNRYNYGLPKFRVGNEDGYIKFDGNSLNIAGPISGIITSSKNIKNANNIVDSENSVAVGTSNFIDKATDNVFIFGSNNTITGARRSSILGGKNNTIKTYLYTSDTLDSSILAGESNTIVGSYSTINGGFGNSIYSATTGLSSLANQIFKTTVNNGISGRINCYYSQSIFTNDLVIFTNIETSRADYWRKIGTSSFSNDSYSSPIYRAKNISEISTQSYIFNLYPATINNENLKINSWVSVKSDNLFSGSFIPEDPNKICEFKIGKTGIETGIKTTRINFQTPYVNYQGDDLIVLAEPVTSGDLSSITSSSHQIVDITGVDRSGFYIDFPSALEDVTFVSYRVGPTGFYTGSAYNIGTSMEINRAQPFKNLISGDIGVYNFNLNRDKICFAQGNKYFYRSFNANGSLGTHLILSGSSQSQSDIVIVKNPNIESRGLGGDNNAYYNINMLGFTGQLNNGNIQVFQTGITGGSYIYQNINLLSGFTGLNQYVPIFNLYTTGAPLIKTVQYGNCTPYQLYYFEENDAYRMILSGRNASSFNLLSLDTGNCFRNLNKDYLLNIAAFRTGNYSFDSANIEVKRILLNTAAVYPSANDTIRIPENIKFDTAFTVKPNVFVYIEEIISGLTYQTVMLNQVFNTGFRVYETGIQLSLPVSSPLKYYLNYIAIGGTGLNTFETKDSVIVDKNLNFSGNIDLPLIRPFNSPVKIFGRAYTKDYEYLHNVYQNTDTSFGFHISNPITVDILTGLTYDYMVTDLERDYNVQNSIIDFSEYTRLAAYGFNDIGSSNIAGGTGNYLQGVVSTIGGGVGNRIVGDFNLIGGGRSNIISDHDYSIFNLYPQVAFCSIMGGAFNAITGNIKYCNILGGQSNTIKNDNEFVELSYSNILGGYKNIISGEYSTIFGGNSNAISGKNSNIIGGTSGIISGEHSNILGSGNKIFGNYSNIFGHNNTITGSNSTIIGNNARISGDGIFYVGDGSGNPAAFLGGANFVYKMPNSMMINKTGGLVLTGYRITPIIIDLNGLNIHSTTGIDPVPVGGIYRSGNFLCVRV